MKKTGLTFLLVSLSLSIISAQLTLEKLNSGKKVIIPNGSTVGIRFPTKSAKPACDCYLQFNGRLVNVTNDSLAMVINEDMKIYGVDSNLTKYINQQYKYDKDTETPSILRSNYAILVIHNKPAMESMNNIGGVLMVLAALNQLILSPFYSPEMRKSSDYVSIASFGVGLTFALLPNKKKYYINQPKEGGKTLWKIKTN
jgi:hypothetical protein